MEILGIGMPELIFIFVIAIIVMGPKDMQKAGKTIGKWLRNIVTSDGWKMFQQTSHELRTLPNRLMREANEDLEQINKIGKDLTNPIEIHNRTYPTPANSHPFSTASVESAPVPPAVVPEENESDTKQDA